MMKHSMPVCLQARSLLAQALTSSMGVARRQPVEKIVRPFQDFAEKQSSGGILLITAGPIRRRARAMRRCGIRN